MNLSLGLRNTVLVDEPWLSWLNRLPTHGAKNGLGFSKEHRCLLDQSISPRIRFRLQASCCQNKIARSLRKRAIVRVKFHHRLSSRYRAPAGGSRSASYCVGGTRLTSGSAHAVSVVPAGTSRCCRPSSM